MIRRVAALLALAGVAWFAYSRLKARPVLAPAGGDEANADGLNGGTVAVTSSPARVVPLPVERVRGAAEGREDGAHAPAASPAKGDDPGAARSSPPAEAAATEPAEAPQPRIKGNIRHDGTKLYHLPGDPAYDDTEPEHWFATVDEAEAAGFRRAGGG